MSYYNYHAKIKNKIKNGELINYYFDYNYNKIGFCLVLVFEDKKYPIREKHFEEYFELIGNLYNTKKIENKCLTQFKR